MDDVKGKSETKRGEPNKKGWTNYPSKILIISWFRFLKEGLFKRIIVKEGGLYETFFSHLAVQ